MSDIDLGSVSTMKVAELKKELKARGLSTAGAKNELQERLQQALQKNLGSEDGNAESEILDEDEVLGDEEEGGDFDDDEADAVLADEPKTEPVSASVPLSAATKRPASDTSSKEVQPKKRALIRPVSFGTENGNQEKKTSEQSDQEKKDDQDKRVIKITGVPVKDRLEMRAQKFGVPLSAEAQKEARAARFGLAPKQEPTKATAKSIISANIGTKKIIKFEGPSAEVLKKRAERFGCNVSSLAIKLEQQEKIKQRQERFGLANSAPITTSTIVKVKTNVSTKAPSLSEMEEKKKARALRFA